MSRISLRSRSIVSVLKISRVRRVGVVVRELALALGADAVRCEGESVEDETGSRIQVEVLTTASPEDVAALARLLPQVSARAAPLTAERVAAVLEGGATRVIVARCDERVVGMALLLLRTTFSGASGYVDEVAVDTLFRGRGIGKRLITYVLRVASDLGLRFVDLTSRDSRVEANGLYQSVGFVKRETNCYRYVVG